MALVTAFIVFLIFLIFICLFFAIVMWAVGRFFPEIAQPARYVLGAFCLILVLLALLRVLNGGSIPALGL